MYSLSDVPIHHSLQSEIPNPTSDCDFEGARGPLRKIPACIGIGIISDSNTSKPFRKRRDQNLANTIYAAFGQSCRPDSHLPPFCFNASQVVDWNYFKNRPSRLPTMVTTPAPNSLGAAVVTVAWVFAALAIVTVAARFYARLKIVRKLFRDDYVILVTFVSTDQRYSLLPHSVNQLITNQHLDLDLCNHQQCFRDHLRLVGPRSSHKCIGVSSRASHQRCQMDVPIRDICHHVARIRPYIICLPVTRPVATERP